MFGYIKPCRPELKIKEFDAYRSVYCGLCRQMGLSFGCFARLTLSYDFTFLCALGYGVSAREPDVALRRCCVNPLKKVPMCAPDQVLAFGADVALLLIYYKLLDNIQDSGIFLRGAWSMLLPPVKAAYRKAARAHPALDEEIAGAMGRQREAEARGAGVDEASEPSAAALSAIFRELSEESAQRRVLERTGYLLGRYVYLCDALDDLEQDRRRGGFNPLLSERRTDPLEDGRGSLFLTAAEVGRAYDLLELTSFRPVLDNVVHLGLVAGVEEILAKKEKRT